MKRYLALALCLLLAVTSAACAKKANDPVIATVNGTELYRSDFDSPFNMYLTQYKSAGYDMTAETNLQALQDLVLTTLINGEVIYQQAVQQKFALTADEEAKNTSDAQAQLDNLLSAYTAQAQANNSADPSKDGRTAFDNALKAAGYTEETYLAQLKDQMKKTALANKLENSATASVTLSDTDAQTQFTADVAAEKASYDADPSAYETAQNNYDAGAGVIPVYTPAGFVRIKHILVASEASASSLEESLKAGEDFDTLMAQYGIDPGMKQDPNKTLGYLVGPSTNFMQEFKDAALALQNVGDLSAPVKTDYGYHIIKLVAKIAPGERAFADVKDAYIAGKLKELKNQKFQSELDAWMKAAKIVKYTDRIRTAGREATVAP